MVKKFQANILALKSDDGEYRKLKNMDKSIKENAQHLAVTPNLYDVLEFKKQLLQTMQEAQLEHQSEQSVHVAE